MKKSLFILLLITTSINAFSQVKFREGIMWGYKDKKTNAVIIKPKFGYATDFIDGFAIVSEKPTTPNQRKKMQIINIKGDYISDSAYESLENLGQGLFKIGVLQPLGGYKFGIMDKTGKIIIQPELTHVSAISEGLIILSSGSRNASQYGAIDTKGNFVIGYQKYVMSDFKCGISVINMTQNKGIMTKTGAILLSPDTSGIMHIQNFNKNCIAEFRKGNRYGLINAAGKILVEPIYSRSSGFGNNGVSFYKDGVTVQYTGTGQKK